VPEMEEDLCKAAASQGEPLQLQKPFVEVVTPVALELTPSVNLSRKSCPAVILEKPQEALAPCLLVEPEPPQEMPPALNVGDVPLAAASASTEEDKSQKEISEAARVALVGCVSIPEGSAAASQSKACEARDVGDVPLAPASAITEVRSTREIREAAKVALVGCVSMPEESANAAQSQAGEAGEAHGSNGAVRAEEDVNLLRTALKALFIEAFESGKLSKTIEKSLNDPIKDANRNYEILDFEEPATPPPPPLKVVIVGARGLRNADWLCNGVSDPYCVCEIDGKPAVKIKTKTVANSLNPAWNHEGQLVGYTPRDSLTFSIYDSDIGKSDDFLGRMTLPSSEFHPHGFDGEKPLRDAGKGVNAFLKIRIAPVDGVSCVPPQDP